MFVIRDIHICYKKRAKRRHFGVREISICYKERRLESFCHKRVSHLLHGEGKQKVFVVNEFHFCYKEAMVGVCHREFHIYYKERRLEGVCPKRVSHNVTKRVGWKVFVTGVFHICHSEREIHSGPVYILGD